MITNKLVAAVDTVTVDVPMLIRLLEWAHESATSDVEIHELAEKLIERSDGDTTLTIDDYEHVVPETKEEAAVAFSLGAGQQELARKSTERLGFVNGTLSHDLVQGGMAFLLSHPKYKRDGDNPLEVFNLVRALTLNKVLLNKVMGEIEEDYHKLPKRNDK